ncbi:MAG: hypothetical protein K0S53_2613 [Bacteroidetes bacterium]|jgi:hypothetical protein|nr:hypothetical protein [Bacteroidota bacterium]
MKKLLSIFLLLCSLTISAQLGKTIKVPKTAGKFYKTFEDFENNKPVEGINFVNITPRALSIEVNKGGQVEKLKDSEIPYEWFCDYFGNLIRVYDKEMYYVIIDGPLCHFVRCAEANVIPTQTENLIFSPKPDEVFKEYYSEKIDGEIKKFKDSMFDEYLEKFALKEQFKEEKLKREAKDSVLDYKNKEWNKRYKYKLLINEKLK